MENVQSNPLTSDSLVISQALRDRLNELKSLHREYIKIEIEFHRNFFALDVEFQKKRQQIFDQRKCIINDGVIDLSIDQMSDDIVDIITKSIQKMHLDEKQSNLHSTSGKMAKCVPHFWLQVLMNCSNNLTFVQDKDNEILKHLCDIRIGMAMEPELSFTLEFEFEPNPFFHNKILTKQYILHSLTAAGEYFGLSITKAIGCSIDWNDGMNVMENGNESFFKFFNPPDLVMLDNMETDSNEIAPNACILLQNDSEIGKVDE